MQPNNPEEVAAREAEDFFARKWAVDGFSMNRVVVIEEDKPGRPMRTIGRMGERLLHEDGREKTVKEFFFGKRIAELTVQEHNQNMDTAIRMINLAHAFLRYADSIPPSLEVVRLREAAEEIITQALPAKAVAGHG